MSDGEISVRFEEESVPSKIFLPSLALSYTLVAIPILLIGVLLIEIGQTFGTPPGVTGQLQTAVSLVSVLVAILMGAWSVRFSHKSLLLAGLLVTTLATVGSFLSLNFPMLVLFLALFGWGTGMIDPMTFTLIGTHYPLEHRARAIGWLVTGFILASIIGSLLFGFIGGVGGEESWRWAFLVLLPVAFLSLGLTIKGVPSSLQSRPLQSSEAYWTGFHNILANRSAIVCLIGNMLLLAGWQAVLLYFVTFLRERFMVSLGVATIIFSAGGLFYIFGSQLGGQIIPRFGRKPVTVLAALGMGIFTISLMVLHHLWLVVILAYALGIFSGMRHNATYSLILEQVPRFRGSMMSLNMAASALGSALGASLGGLTLLWWSFEGVGLTLGALCLVAAVMYYFLAVDPAIKQAI